MMSLKDKCVLCDKEFVVTTPIKKFCNHYCRDLFGKFKRLPESKVYRLSIEDKEMYLKVKKIIGGNE